MKSKPKALLLPLFFVLLLSVSSSFAQRITGTILGTVTDTSGAVVPGVTVTVTNLETNLKQSAVSSERGYYEIPNLPLGEYVVTAELTGFKRAEFRGVVLRVETQGRVDIKLEIGQVSETVEVEAVSPLVNTTDATVGAV